MNKAIPILTILIGTTYFSITDPKFPNTESLAASTLHKNDIQYLHLDMVIRT